MCIEKLIEQVNEIDGLDLKELPLEVVKMLNGFSNNLLVDTEKELWKRERGS